MSARGLVLQKSNPVDFLIVGAGGAGTTTLFEILTRHPDIFIPPRKECRYFSDMPGNFIGPGADYANDSIRSKQQYCSLFKAAKPGQLCGDISPDYLYYHKKAVPKILNEAGQQIPIIIVLRNPIDRAYSNYSRHVRNGRETLSFEEALQTENTRLNNHWIWGYAYTRASMFADAVDNYQNNFKRVLVLLFEEDIVTGKAALKILEFLGLEPHLGGIPDIHANTSGHTKSRLLHRIKAFTHKEYAIVRYTRQLIKLTPFYAPIRRVYRRFLEANLKKREMDLKTRLMLKEKFDGDVALLAEQTHLPIDKFWTDFTIDSPVKTLN